MCMSVSICMHVCKRKRMGGKEEEEEKNRVGRGNKRMRKLEWSRRDTSCAQGRGRQRERRRD